jgi:polyisoprenoid-binding protein YceI
MLRLVLGSLLILFTTAVCTAQEYQPTDQGSQIGFEIKNFGIKTHGSFSGLDGRIVWDPNDLTRAVFDVSIGAATINTDNEMRDGHLRKEVYFDAEKYPRIRLVSTEIAPPDKHGHYTFRGKLTIKDVTKDISFTFIATPMGEDWIFQGGFPLNRRDFHVGAGSTIANNLTVSLTVLAKKR